MDRDVEGRSAQSRDEQLEHVITLLTELRNMFAKVHRRALCGHASIVPAGHGVAVDLGGSSVSFDLVRCADCGEMLRRDS